MGDQMSESTSLISSSNAVLNILMQTSLNQFWSLINSQQIVIQLPLMDAIQFPANVMLVNKVFTDIANFEVIPSDVINAELYVFPEEDPFNLNFQECGVESKNFLLIMGFQLYIILGHMILAALYLVLYLANLKLKLKYLTKLNNYLSAYLFWNGLIRLFMEVYLGMALASVLSMYTVDWQSSFTFVKISNASGLVCLIIIVSLPILVLIPFYCRRREHWKTIEFKDKYGALLESTRLRKRDGKPKSDWVAMLVPMTFFYRRMIFIMSVILLNNNILTIIFI